MIREAVQQLRDHIAALPVDKFDYSVEFVNGQKYDDYYDGLTPPCGSAGCVMGHAVTLFQRRMPEHGTIAQAATNYLGLSVSASAQLFFEGCEVATRADALRRLDYLLANNGSFMGYRFCDEDNYTYDGFVYDLDLGY